MKYYFLARVDTTILFEFKCFQINIVQQKSDFRSFMKKLLKLEFVIHYCSCLKCMRWASLNGH